MHSAPNRIRIILTLCLLVVADISAFGQSITGRIIGTVHDQSGAAIGGATVTVADVQRGTSRTVTTGAEGEYVVSSLDPGTYQVRAEAKGFKIVERPNVLVEVASDISLDISLPPGNVSETVVVQEDVPLLNTTSATLGGTLSNAEINDLPLSGRNYENLLQLRPGIMRYPGGGFSTTSANGLRAEDNAYFVEGLLIASRIRGRQSSMVPVSPATPRRFCRLMPSRSSTSSKIPPPNMDGSREQS
jgi:hypothetical protein